MEWYLAFAVIFGSFILLLATGMPVAFAFLIVNMMGMGIFYGGVPALLQLINHIFSGLATVTYLPMVLFILLGNVVFSSEISLKMLGVVDVWLGRLPGRLGIASVVSGVGLGALTGDTTASTAILAKSLVPEMEKRGYKKPMSVGPVLGSCGLAMMIPPSNKAILIGVLGDISIAGMLMAGILPGLLMALFYVLYILIRVWLQPSLAPSYPLPSSSLFHKLWVTVRDLLPLLVIVFAIIGFILLGITTPSEAAATGTLATFILAAVYRGLNWERFKTIFVNTVDVCAMAFLLIMSAEAFSQLLAISGAARGLAALFSQLQWNKVQLLLVVQLLPLLLGMFMGGTAVLMITLPLVLPIVHTLGINPLLYGVTLLLCIEIGSTSPPFGWNLFVMKIMGPPDTTIGDCYRGALPFIGCDLIVLALMISFPSIALWLPSVMR
jgi:tripartite ATP-independent transporter DctM subunit